jgi:phosphohistidine phosphatase
VRQLILMRHAKSDWAEPGMADHSRPLNDRGRSAADAIAAWLAHERLIPNRILSSTSVRTTQTVTRLLDVWRTLDRANNVDIRYRPELYLAHPQTMLQTLADEHLALEGDDEPSNAGAAIDRVMIVAHNPGMQMWASMLAGVEIEFPTAALAVSQWSIDAWTSMRSASRPDRCTIAIPNRDGTVTATNYPPATN